MIKVLYETQIIPNRMYLLPEEDIGSFEGLGQHKRLLIVDIVIRSAVNQVVLLATELVGLLANISIVIALQIVLGSRQAHEALRINGIVVDPVCDGSHRHSALENVFSIKGHDAGCSVAAIAPSPDCRLISVHIW